MSLALTVTQTSGVDATFWTLNSLYLDAINQNALIRIDGYTSGEAKTNGFSPLTAVEITIVFVPTNVLPNVSVMQALYSKIQLDDFFVGSVYTNDGV